MDASLRYDTLGRLSRFVTGGITTQFHYDGDALIAEYRDDVLDKRYVHGDQVDEPLVLYTDGAVSTNSRRFLHADHQGSIIAWSNSTGAAARKNAYDPYGIPRPSNSGRFGYTGQTWIPELGLNYYKARIYSPRLGRFLQTDPIFYEDNINLYAYAGNDPANVVDPSGTQGVNEDFMAPNSELNKLKAVLVGAKEGGKQAAQESVSEIKADLAEKGSVQVKMGGSAVLGVTVSAAADGQTIEDGTIEGKVQVGQTGKFELAASATVNYRVAGEKDIGPVEASFGLKVGMVGLEVNKGPKGANWTVALGPQVGVYLKVPKLPVTANVGHSERIPLPGTQ